MNKPISDEAQTTDNLFEVLDRVSEQNGWQLEPWGDDAATIAIPGAWQDSNMAVTWHEYHSAIVFSVPLAVRVTRSRIGAARSLTSAINESLLIGHFETSNEGYVSLRYAMLLADIGYVQETQLRRTAQMLNEAVQRFFPSYRMMQRGMSLGDALSAALVEPMGTA